MAARALLRRVLAQRLSTAPWNSIHSSKFGGSAVYCSATNRYFTSSHESRGGEKEWTAAQVGRKIASALKSENLAEARALCVDFGESLDPEFKRMVSAAHADKRYADTTAAADAEAWLDRTYTLDERVTLRLHYNYVLSAWNVSTDPRAPERAYALLGRMEEMEIANSFSYDKVMDIYASQGDVDKAGRLLERMHERNISPEMHTCNIVMKVYVRRKDMQEAENFLSGMESDYLSGEMCSGPDCVTYNTLMDGWTKYGGKDSLSHVEDVFRRQKEMYHVHKNEDARPDKASYRILIIALCKNEKAEEAEKQLMQMYHDLEDEELSRFTNSALVDNIIHCWKNLGRYESAERAEKLLMWKINEYKKTGWALLAPSAYDFSSVMSAWARSKNRGKALRARTLLEQMGKLHADGTIEEKPNTPCYNAVLNTCSYSNRYGPQQCREALGIAIATYKELRKAENCSPDEISFGNMIGALRNLAPPTSKKWSMIAKVFHQCAEAGFVNIYLLDRMQTILSEAQLRDLLGEDAVGRDGRLLANKLPREWSRNIKSR